MKRHEDDFTCRLKRLRTRQRRQRLQMLKATGCCSECQVRQIHFVFQSCLINLFTLSICFDVILLRCNYALKHWSQLYEMQCLDPPLVQFSSMSGASGETSAAGPEPEKAQRLQDCRISSRWGLNAQFISCPDDSRSYDDFVEYYIYLYIWYIMNVPGEIWRCVCVQGEVHYGRTRH